MDTTKSEYDTRRVKGLGGRAKSRGGVSRADNIRSTRASLDEQTLLDPAITVHITHRSGSIRVVTASRGRAARGERVPRFTVSVPAGVRLIPTALEKLAWAFISFPNARTIWAGREACRRCTTETPRAAGSEEPLAIIARRVDVSDEPGFDRVLHVTEHLAWREADTRIDGPDVDVQPPAGIIICLAQKVHSWTRPGDPVDLHVDTVAPAARGRRRLLLLVPWLAMGGADKFNLDVMRLLKARGWRISVVTTLPGDDAWQAEFAALSDDLFMLPRLLRLHDWPRFIRHIIRSRGIGTVLITNSEFGYHLVPALRAADPALRVVDYCHMEQEEWKQGGYPRLAALYQPHLDGNLVSTQHLKRWLERRGALGSKIDVLHTNIDAASWKPCAETRATVRRALRIPEEATMLLFAGRLDPQKQPAVLAETLQHLADKGVPFHAVIAGDGAERATLEAALQDSAAGVHTTLLGAVPNTEIKRLMQAADIFFLPSAMEGLSLAIYEAMAAGLCVVGAAVGGQRELVTAGSGVLIESGPVEQQAARYAEVLERLVRDARYRRRLGAAARARVVKHFDLELLGDALDRALTARPPATPRHRTKGDLALAASLATAAVEMTRLESFLQAMWRTVAEAQEQVVRAKARARRQRAADDGWRSKTARPRAGVAEAGSRARVSMRTASRRA